MREIQWICVTLDKPGVCQSDLTVLHQDNLGAISSTNKVQGLRKVKHIVIRYHNLRDAVELKVLQAHYVATTGNVAQGRKTFWLLTILRIFAKASCV